MLLLYSAGWNDDQISEQKSFTDGRILIAGTKATRKKQKRADYLLRYQRDFTIAVVEAKAEYRHPGDGLQQAKEYAQILGVQFAYATNGHGIVEHDFLTGNDNDLDAFPTPDALWGRLRQAENISDDIADRLLEPYYHLSGKSPRYYQEIAINRAVQAILQGKRRALLLCVMHRFEGLCKNPQPQQLDKTSRYQFWVFKAPITKVLAIGLYGVTAYMVQYSRRLLAPTRPLWYKCQLLAKDRIERWHSWILGVPHLD